MEAKDTLISRFMKWIELTDTETLQNLHNTSKTGLTSFVIFKNSTRCSTSRLAMKLFESSWNGDIPVYLVQVVEHRKVSNEIEKIYRVQHESPQVLMVKNGNCIYHSSHSRIDAEHLMKLAVSE